MVSRDEKVLVDARRKYYEKINRGMKNKKRLQFGEYTGKDNLYTIQPLTSSRQLIIYFITFQAKLCCLVSLQLSLCCIGVMDSGITTAG